MAGKIPPPVIPVSGALVRKEKVTVPRPWITMSPRMTASIRTIRTQARMHRD
jgi:hypothetical protein